MTSPRRTALTVGVGAGGLLATAFLSTAVAFADNYVYAPDPTSPETITANNGIPPLFGDATGTQIFDVDDTTVAANTTTDPHGLPDVVGQFGANVSNWTLGSITNEEVVVTSLNSGAPTTALETAAIASTPTVIINPAYATYDATTETWTTATTATANDPTVGSVFDTLVLPFLGVENIYDDVVTPATTAGGSATYTVTDELINSSTGAVILNLDWLFGGFNLAKDLAGDTFSFNPF